MRVRVVLALLLALTACARDDEKPEARPAPMPVPRTEVAGVNWSGGPESGPGVIVLGGLTADGAASVRVDFYVPTANRWRRFPDLPIALHHTAAVRAFERLFVIGGYTIEDGSWKESARVFSLGEGERSWRTEAPLPASRGAHAAADFRPGVVVAGGVVQGKVSPSVVIFDGRTWREGPPLARAREHLAVTARFQRVYAIAGRDNGVNFADVEAWDGRQPAWVQQPPLNDSRGGIAAAVMPIGGRPCVAGGEEAAGTIASVECLGRTGWERVGRLRTPRHGVAVVATVDRTVPAGIVNRLHVIGGGPQPGLTVSDVHEVFNIRRVSR